MTSCRITNDDREKEMENNVSEVAGMIGNLRNMACDMGNEISNQNKALGRINLKVTSSLTSMKSGFLRFHSNYIFRRN